ncbi:MAG: SiaB family protein kinase [Bacteroidales bacterium]|nr:SiaB family protein kinase [Bacteroidales bacterium]
MSDSTKVLNNISYELYKSSQNDTLEYTYRGVVDSAVVENILSLAESSFSDVKEQLIVRKKVYFIMVELLQNITRHQEIYSDPDFDQSGLFIIKRKDIFYTITSANLIKNDGIESLRNKIDIVNSKSPEELKEYAREVLSNGTFSSKGGAGLGLIEMARKSGSKFKYKFVPSKYGYSTFYINIDIPIRKDTEIKRENDVVIGNILDYHKVLQKNNVALNFSGTLNQTNLKNLLNILSRQIHTSKLLKTKVYCVMIELLQNILAHADRRENETESACYGQFFIRQNKEHIMMTSGNIINNNNIKALTETLEFVNNADKETRMNIMKSDNPKGQGFITIINKSRHQYDYDFIKLNENYSLYSMNVYLDKENENDITM